MNRFPFGRPATRRPPRQPAGPAALFVLGVYPSALHVRWTLPDQLIAAWQDQVNWAPEWGTIASVGGNGSSGRIVTEHVLNPLGVHPQQAYFTDCLPTYFVKSGPRSQGGRIRAVYDPFAAASAGRLAPADLPPRPTPRELVGRAVLEERDLLLAQLTESGAPAVVTLGQEAADVLAAIIDTRPITLVPDDTYGRPRSLNAAGRPVEWLALVHPGNRATSWATRHRTWMTQQQAEDATCDGPDAPQGARVSTRRTERSALGGHHGANVSPATNTISTFEAHDVRLLRSATAIFPAEKGRRGIYVLHFQDGTGYVGQASDICSRFTAHRRTYPDLTMIEFARVPPTVTGRDLDGLEQAEMRIRGQQIELRNVTHYLGRDITLRPSTLDPIIPAAHQLSFLEDGNIGADAAGRVVDPKQLQVGKRAYQRFRAHPLADDVVTLGRMYIQQTIPCPRATERRFWAASAAPSTNGGARLMTVSINKPETLVVGALDGQGWGFMNVSRTSLVESHGSLADFHSSRQEWLELEEARYEACGGDAIALRVWDIGRLADLLTDDAVLDAAARLNLQLMRKGTTLQGRWHNYELAEYLLEPFTDG